MVSNMLCSQVEIPDMKCIITINIIIIIMHYLALW